MGKKAILMLEQKYIDILRKDEELSKRVEELVSSFGAVESDLLRESTAKSLSETVEKMIRERYPEI